MDISNGVYIERFQSKVDYDLRGKVGIPKEAVVILSVGLNHAARAYNTAIAVICEGLYGDDLVGAYQQADIFFPPSIWEMLALVVLKAMAAGLPQVVTNISGSQDVIETGVNGLVFEPNQPDNIAEAPYKLGDP